MFNQFNRLFDIIPSFWQGVIASIVATIIIAITVKIYSIYSLQAKTKKQKKDKFITSIQEKINSSDSIIRVEGYFISLFYLLRYLFIGITLLAASLSFEDLGVLKSIPAIGGLLFFYAGLRWLSLITKEPASHKVTENSLVINYAKYGIGEKHYDVTNTVLGLIHNGRVKLTADNSTFGDPAVGEIKELTINYSYMGNTYTRTIPEKETLTLP